MLLQRLEMKLERNLPCNTICFLGNLNKSDLKNFSNDVNIKTKESGDSIKVWNHTMQLKKIDNQQTQYTDEVIIYNGLC